MYSIYADDLCIYNDVLPTKELKLISPSLTMEENSAGSFSTKIPKDNPGYNSINRMTTEISIKRDGNIIWSGRITEENVDFYNQREIYCEGTLAYFNDSLCQVVSFTNTDPKTVLTQLLNNHNSRVESKKQIFLGNVTVTTPVPSLSAYYDYTINVIYDMIEQIGGFLIIRYENGKKYLDYLSTYPSTSSQKIEFGKNLLDLTKNYDLTSLITVLLPLGAQIQNEDGSTRYVTIESVNGGSPYLESSDAMGTYGRIEGKIQWSDIEDPSQLLSKAQNYLSDAQFDAMSIDSNVIDMHYIDFDVTSINFMEAVHVISKPHGLDRLFPVSKITIPLDNPENASFTLGTDQKTTLTKEDRQEVEALRLTIAGLPNQAQINNIVNSINTINNTIDKLPTDEDYKDLEDTVNKLPDESDVERIFNDLITGYFSLGQTGSQKEFIIEALIKVLNSETEENIPALTDEIQIGDKTLKIINGIVVSYK